MTNLDRLHAATAEQVLARSGRTFHLASRLLPRQMRHDATLLYAFCRRMDDYADESASGESERLAEMAYLLQTESTGPRAAALGWPISLEQRYPGISAFAAVLTQALANDTGPQQLASDAALYTYAYGVAGTVGLMMCRILGASPEGAEAARDLGIAMQLTNIARDIREDLARDRIYLPVTWIAPAAVRLAVHGGDASPLEQAIQKLLVAADHLYASADRGMGYLPWRARIGILSAAGCYREIGIVVRRDIPRSWRQRAVVPGRRKAILVASSLLRSLFYRRPAPMARTNSSPRLHAEKHS